MLQQGHPTMGNTTSVSPLQVVPALRHGTAKELGCAWGGAGRRGDVTQLCLVLVIPFSTCPYTLSTTQQIARTCIFRESGMHVFCALLLATGLQALLLEEGRTGSDSFSILTLSANVDAPAGGAPRPEPGRGGAPRWRTLSACGCKLRFMCMTQK